MNPTGPVGVGVIGAGVISAEYLRNLTRFPDVDVRYVADLDLARAAARAAEFDVPASGDVEGLLADETIEIVVNLTIPAAHAEVGLRILDAGKHVWAEKPLALDREAGRVLLDRAEALGLRVASAPDTFLGPGLQNAQRVIADGGIGTPVTAAALFRSPGPESWHPNPEFLFDHGAGPLFDIGPYYLTALVQQLGPIGRVVAAPSTARATRVIGSGPKAGTVFEVRVPTHHAALIEFESGASAQAIFSFESVRAHPPTVEFNGTSGTLELPDPNTFGGPSLLWTDGSERPRELAAPDPKATRGTGVLELARAIRAGVAERASGALAFHVLDAMVAISESAQSRQPVAVESTAPRPALLPSDWDPTAATL
ncbi:Gfo/Idh/MocA family protein [Glycomyces harbinensis]|uniref:Predicted dehydrogenase n=1 Tax=Glycomyces harbinensis TaxID=58114 RepID=A0A1G6ZLG0_9ACTN|nr:Gfo/Idh/MocA family oxidoreductase [Glycomyces harbinensis]SDE03087.1 Predicted dehydrogenase [Glycomyces harbinensis]